MIAERPDIRNFSTGTQAQIPHTFVWEHLLMEILSNLVIGKVERSQVYKKLQYMISIRSVVIHRLGVGCGEVLEGTYGFQGVRRGISVVTNRV